MNPHKSINLILFVTIIISNNVYPTNSISISNWFWDKTQDDTTVLITDSMPLVSIPFEAMTEDEKFLQEASKLSDLQISSPLATCQHKVIIRIKTSCSDMTEEELAKLSVNLLNCQSAIEGRKMFICTDDMSLKQCTTDMDADMWNAYHLMSNRARAVCYAARSTEFRALTELTVNKLMNSAHTQVEALKSLKESQDKLTEQTIDALSSLSEGNKILLQQQEHLKDAQASSHHLVTSNLKDLNNEKALIRAGHAQLAAMTSDIKNKLEKASQQLMEQTVERGQNHKEVIEDLIDIQQQIQLIWKKIETSTDRIIQKHENAMDQYEHTLTKLSQINNTIQFIWDTTNTMRNEIDDKLEWIQKYIGNTGEQMHKIYRVILHVVYLLGAMLIASFLQAPLLTRITIVGIVPMNLISYLKNGLEACLDLPSITVLIILITFMHFVMNGIQYIFGAKRIEQPPGVVYSKPANGHNLFSWMNSIYLIFIKNINKLHNTIVYSTNYCKDQIKHIANKIVSWTQQDTTFEELSCSYTSANKSYNNVLLNTVKQDYLSHGNDTTDFDDFYHSDDDMKIHDNYISISPEEVRRRFIGSKRSYTPTLPSPTSVLRGHKRTCNAYTRSGKRCRLFVGANGEYCSKHIDGSSILDDN